MYVSEIKNHRLHNNECLGDLKFDCAASKKWGLCWRERLACTDCDFVSEYHNTNVFHALFVYIFNSI
jgi:hypothetical protein